MPLLARLTGIDPRKEADLHIALWRKAGRGVGAVAILGDFAKGAIPVVVGTALGLPLCAVAFSGVAAVAGQMWPLFQGFNGEKGNTTGLAMAAALAYKPLLIALIPMAAGVTIRTVPRLLESRHSLNERLKLGGPPSRSLPLGMAIGFGMLAPISWWLEEPPVITYSFLLLFILIMVRRLTADLKSDLAAVRDRKRLLINRLLFDRSFVTGIGDSATAGQGDV